MVVLPPPPGAPPVVYTVGHSTRTADAFVEILTRAGITTLADVRRFPGSRRHPQFSRDQLPAILAAHGIAYHHFPDLGGRRDPAPDSINTAWRNASFRGYADYMVTSPFHQGVTQILGLASPVVIMCAEAVWWRCHRGLIADYLVAMGLSVLHLGDAGRTTAHTGTSAATIGPGELSYSGPQGSLALD
jgi:uncharacterized protein (DUF488 family)